MIHYHCADIHPHHRLTELAGKHLLVSHAYPTAAMISHQIAQSCLLDNGAFSVWKSGKSADWNAYYEWSDVYLDSPTTWAIIPDIIDAGEEAQDDLIAQWPHSDRGAPVWHMNESMERLFRLIDVWPRVCLGSAGEYPTVGSSNWHRRMTHAFNEISKRGRLPWLHGLRMQSIGHLYPFGSVDSADIARNNNRPQNTIRGMAARWDCVQPAIKWEKQPEQLELAG